MSSAILDGIMKRFAICWLAAMAAACGADDQRVTVRPADAGEALVNPAWVDDAFLLEPHRELRLETPALRHTRRLARPLDNLLRVPWSFLEPREGEFNWALFDTPAQRWIAKGKRHRDPR